MIPVMVAGLAQVACNSSITNSAASDSAPVGQVPTEEATTEATTAAPPQAMNMALLGTHDLQGRSAYQPVIHNYGGRHVLFVGHHEGQATNPATGQVETNGLSILDVTDPALPVMLAHVPPMIEGARGTQHVQVCNGSDLPQGDRSIIYALRSNGRLGWDLLDTTDPEAPEFLSKIAETGISPRLESERGNQETHKFQWVCETGIAYLNGTVEDWRVTRVLTVYDLGNPLEPKHIRDFALAGWEPDTTEPDPPAHIAGLHQPVIVGDRMYLGYESGDNGVLQIIDVPKFLQGDPQAEDAFAPTPENLLYPQIARFDMPSYWGVHTAKPIYDFAIADYVDDRDNSVRDFLIIPSEAGGGSKLRCQEARDAMFIFDITDEETPMPVSNFQVPEEPGDFCNKGGRFGPHSVHDAYHPAFDKTMAVVSYFNAGVRAVDIRNPFSPVEVGYYIPEPNDNTAESCVTVDSIEHCDRVIMTNNVNIDDRGYIYAVDRKNAGLHVLELTGSARAVVGLDD